MKKNLLFLLFTLIFVASCSDDKTGEVAPNPMANTEWVTEKGDKTLQFSEKLVALKGGSDGRIVRIFNYTYDDKKIIARGVENSNGVPYSFTAGVVSATIGNKEHLWIRESSMYAYDISKGEKYYKK